MDNKYSKLIHKNDYDQEAAEQLAEAMNEAVELTRQLHHIRTLIQDNTKLAEFVWTTAEGVASALHKLDTDHLKNILTYIAVQRGSDIPKAIRAEALSRGLDIPEVALTDHPANTLAGMMTYAQKLLSDNNDVIDYND